MRNTQELKASDLRIAYIGGGSRGWAWGFMKDLAMDEQICGTLRLYDIDRAAAERNKIIGEKISAHPDAVSRWSYEVCDSLQQVLTGADFVVISILPATFEEMRSDVHLPERLGIWQPVGDTVGAGGFMRAMRTIPMFVEIGTAIRDYAPDAWVINYTNPMSLCVRTLYEVFPQIKAFGCCHEVFGTQKLLCAMLKDQCGIEGVRRQDLYTTVTGINHFTWLTRASWQGEETLPIGTELTVVGVEGHYDAEQDYPDKLICLTDGGRLITLYNDGVVDVVDSLGVTAKTTSSVKLREAPGKTAAVARTLSKGEKVEVLLRGEGWTMVKYKNQTGYVMSRYLQFP